MEQMTRKEWNINVSRIEAMIETDGLVNVLGAVLEALEHIEEDIILEQEDFYETAEGRSFQHHKEIIELAIQACDLHVGRDSSEDRKAAREDFIRRLLPDIDKAKLYEKLRRMNPREYAELYKRHIEDDMMFDELLRQWPIHVKT